MPSEGMIGHSSQAGSRGGRQALTDHPIRSTAGLGGAPLHYGLRSHGNDGWDGAEQYGWFVPGPY